MIGMYSGYNTLRTDNCSRLFPCVTVMKSEVITDYCFKVFLLDNTHLTAPPEIAFSEDILIDPGLFSSYNFLPLFSFFLLIQLISFCYSMDWFSRLLTPLPSPPPLPVASQFLDPCDVIYRTCVC
jgi:hypothetical protein